MASIFSPFFFFFFFFGLFSQFKFTVQDSPLVPAIYVLGDSLIDVGNNNYLKSSLAKANFPHNGVDFPNHQPTGRFSNGKNVADYLAEKVGLPSPPPYYSLVSENGTKTNTTTFLTGVNFASGGAGILDEIRSIPPDQFVSLIRQVENYSSVYEVLVEELGSSAVQAHLSKSLFMVVIGSNDIFGYYASSDVRNKSTPQEYVDLMASTLESQLKLLYKYGARKYVIGGVGFIGCVPAQRRDQKTGECRDEMNYWVAKYNTVLKLMLYRLKAELKNVTFSYVDAYEVISDYIRTPSPYGFKEVKAACCGLGRLGADFPCTPISSLCPNRNDHLFWDLYHPTQEANRILVDNIFDGPSKYVYPLNIKELIAA